MDCDLLSGHRISENHLFCPEPHMMEMDRMGSVERIVHDRKMGGRKMDADLMSPPGFQGTCHEQVSFFLLQASDDRLCFFSGFREPVFSIHMAVSSDLSSEREFLAWHRGTSGDGKIVPGDLFLFEHRIIPWLKERVLHEEDQAGGFTVKAVDIADRSLDIVLQLISSSFCSKAGIVIRIAVDDDAWFFMGDIDIVVFIDYLAGGF